MYGHKRHGHWRNTKTAVGNACVDDLYGQARVSFYLCLRVIPQVRVAGCPGLQDLIKKHTVHSIYLLVLLNGMRSRFDRYAIKGDDTMFFLIYRLSLASNSRLISSCSLRLIEPLMLPSKPFTASNHAPQTTAKIMAV